MSNQPKNQPKIILASQSPRRRELLSRMGITHFDVLPAQGEEHIDHSLPAGLLVEALARQKAAEIAACAPPDAVIIAADTVVALDNEILGKPHTAQEAAEMLQKLSGRRHTVYTTFTDWKTGRSEPKIDKLKKIAYYFGVPVEFFLE